MSDATSGRSETDPVILYLQSCIEEDIRDGNTEAQEIDESLLSTYQKGFVRAEFRDGEWLFFITPDGREAHLLHTAEMFWSNDQIAEA